MYLDRHIQLRASGRVDEWLLCHCYHCSVLCSVLLAVFLDLLAEGPSETVAL